MSSAIVLSQERELSDLERQGLIQAFEFTFDMAWKTLRDYVVEMGYSGERDKPIRIIVDAAERSLVIEKEWRLAYQSRNKTSHSYDEAIAEEVATAIITVYHDLFVQMETRMQLEVLNWGRED